MANPNKTVARFPLCRPTGGRAPDPELKAVMDAVSKGELTAQQGADRVREIMEERDVKPPSP